jgi:hypothetical protein
LFGPVWFGIALGLALLSKLVFRKSLSLLDPRIAIGAALLTFVSLAALVEPEEIVGLVIPLVVLMGFYVVALLLRRRGRERSSD